MSASDPGPAEETLLVVEDDDLTRQWLDLALRRAGYRVIMAANGLEALEALRSGPLPDLILLDMLMPVLDGWAFLGRLQQALPPIQVPILITTAGVTSQEWAEAHGCAGAMQKPLEEGALLAEIRRCLATPPTRN